MYRKTEAPAGIGYEYEMMRKALRESGGYEDLCFDEISAGIDAPLGGCGCAFWGWGLGLDDSFILAFRGCARGRSAFWGWGLFFFFLLLLGAAILGGWLQDLERPQKRKGGQRWGLLGLGAIRKKALLQGAGGYWPGSLNFSGWPAVATFGGLCLAVGAGGLHFFCP